MGIWMKNVLLALVMLLQVVACDGGHDRGAGNVPPKDPAPKTESDPPPGILWTEAAVRKVLHLFAYGGQASDAQIKSWAALAPEVAIAQMLTFDEVNPLLSPVVDATGAQGGTLEQLQTHWSSSDAENATREDLRSRFAVLATNPNTNLKSLSASALINTWVASTNKSGLNPFRQKVGLFLTNYLMAVSLYKVRPTLIRGMYDDVMSDLAAGEPMWNILARGATSAAVAMHYGHYTNTFDNNTLQFRGNDDFAREFHQLFFRDNGRDFPQEYHEEVTIENTARALTGMRIDRDASAWGGSDIANDYWLNLIEFSDHTDAMGTVLNNATLHHAGDLEILGATISGATARDKIYALSGVAINVQESLDNLPVYMIGHFADDNLNAEKIQAIRTLWRELPQKDLLMFLRAYAISPMLHRSDTFKYYTAVDRNLLLFNLNTVDNEEAYENSWIPSSMLSLQGLTPFIPAHDVFGGQTSLDAVNNPDIFKLAYNAAVDNYWFVVKYQEKYTDSAGDHLWEKQWSRVMPPNAVGVYRVREIAEWLWQRFVADDLAHYGLLERAYVTAFLATGLDFGFVVNEVDPEHVFSETELSSEPYASYINAHEAAILNLDSNDTNTRYVTQRNIGLAVDFISMTPFMFATGGG